RDDAIVVVMFAAAGLEALMQDIMRVALLQPIDEKTATLGMVLNTIEASKGSSALKLQMTAVVLSVRPIATDGQLWETVRLLLRLRDETVRLNPHASGAPNKLAKALIAKRLCRHLDERSTNWWPIVSTPAVAHWALTTVLNLERHYVSLLPETAWTPL